LFWLQASVLLYLLRKYNMKMTSMLLMLVVLPSIFISLSLAYTCYDCSSILASNCENPSSSTPTCTGDICFKTKTSVSGGRHVICSLYLHFTALVFTNRVPVRFIGWSTVQSVINRLLTNCSTVNIRISK